MTYSVGIDLGTTFTAAAVSRQSGTEMVTLGDHSAEMPSVVLLRQDGAILTGLAADRRASLEPERVAREFKRRLGDPTPLIIGGAPQAATSLLAHLLRSVVAKVTAAQGESPSVVTLTHPANWGPYKRDLFNQVPQLAEISNVRMVTEPVAAAAHYASAERVVDGAAVAVYDLGGGTFDATVLRKTKDSFQILGEPQGIEGLGGIDFDEAVFAHVRRSLGEEVTGDRESLVRLRNECVLAKEALSADTEATIPVLLPGMHTHIRLTRGEFEDMIRPSLADTLTTLRGALRSASVAEADLTAVLLVGGSSRIPLVAKMVSAELKCPIAVDTHPKHAVALGAAALNTPKPITAPATAVRPVPAAATPNTAKDVAAALHTHAPMTVGGTAARPVPAAAVSNTAKYTGTKRVHEPATASLRYQPTVLAGFHAAAASSGPGSVTPSRDVEEQSDDKPRFGAGDAPPPLAPASSWLPTVITPKRSAILLATLIIAPLLGLGGFTAGLFGGTAPVGHSTPAKPPAPVQPPANSTSLVQPAPVLPPQVADTPQVAPPPLPQPPAQETPGDTPPPQSSSSGGSDHHSGTSSTGSSDSSCSSSLSKGHNSGNCGTTGSTGGTKGSGGHCHNGSDGNGSCTTNGSHGGNKRPTSGDNGSTGNLNGSSGNPSGSSGDNRGSGGGKGSGGNRGSNGH